VSVALSTETPYKGSTITVSIFFISDSEQELTISFYGVNFDWMESDKFAGHNISSDPITVAAHGSASLTPITVQIPENATIGPHTYYVGIDGEDESTNTFSWDSNTMTVVLQTSAQDAYDGLLSQVESGISDATEASYQSPDAQSLLAQAETSYSQAQNYGNRQQYDEAINALETASFYLDQAETEEQNYVPPKNDQDLLILVIAAAAFIVVIVLVLLLTRKRRQIPVVQPSEL
jgi:hypothetical protein